MTDQTGLCDHSKCTGCPFGTRRIGGRGPEDSPFVIVGESPGSTELATGKPFMGPSGRMLTDILNEVGLPQTGIEPYITNALSCYPGSAKDVPSMQKATHACRERLLGELTAHPRQVILCLGAAASWAVTGDFNIKITQARGQVRQSPLASEGVVLAVHPAFLMRNGQGLPFWKKDLGLAVKLLKGEKPSEFVPPTWSVVENRREYWEVVKEYIQPKQGKGPKPLITGDVETDSLDSITGRLLSLGTTHNGSHVNIIPEEVLYPHWDLTKQLLEANPGKSRWNWHNGKFDIRWFWHPSTDQPRINARVDEDTMLLSYAYNENKGIHDLDQVAHTWIGAPNHKKAIDKYLPNKKTSYRVIPKAELYKYQAYDVAKTHRMWFPLHEAVFADADLKLGYETLLIPCSNFYPLVEEYGVAVDMDVVRQNYEAHTKELAQLNREIQVYSLQYLGKEINVGSPAQLKELLWDKMKLGAPGQSTDEDHLVKAQRITAHPIIDLLLKWREVAKRNSTYVMNLVGTDKKPSNINPKTGRVHMTYKIHGTTTGRPAGADPNLLNQPRGKIIRSQYVAKPGHCFVEVDENQAELRSLAYLSKDPLLHEIYTKNEVSIHDVTTAKFFGSKQDMIRDPQICEHARRQLILSPDLSPAEVYKEAKMRGKAVNFGIVYGREAFSLAEEFNIPIQEAARWIQAWFNTYPGAFKFINSCRIAAARGQSITTPFGRRKRFGVVSQDNLQALQNEAANFPHQSIASDIMTLVAMEAQPILEKNWGAKIWLTLYDATYFEIEQDYSKIQEATHYVQELVTEIPKRWGIRTIPFIGDAKIGTTWGNMVDYSNDDDLQKFFEGLRQQEQEAA